MFAFDAYLRTQNTIPYPPAEGAYAFWQGIDILFLLWAALGASATWQGGRWHGWLAWILYTAQAFVLGWSGNAPRLGLSAPIFLVASLVTAVRRHRSSRPKREALEGLDAP